MKVDDIMNKKNNFKSYLIILLVSLFTFLFVFGGFYLYYNFTDNNQNKISNINNDKKEDNTNGNEDIKNVEAPYTNQLPSYREQYGNNDILGRLEIPNINISTLVTRTTNNEFYLNNNLYKQYDGLGVPLFDFRNINLNTDRQINIYGHNTQNADFYDRLPFVNLEKYTDINNFNNYKDIYLDIDERRMHYRVVATKIVDNSQIEHMKVIFYSDDDYIQHLNKLFSNTMYKDDNLSIDVNDRFLVLQVCHYDPMDTYLLIIGKEVKK